MYGLASINKMFTAGSRADYIIVGNKDYHNGRVGAECRRPTEEWERKARANLQMVRRPMHVNRGPKPQTLARIEEMSKPRNPLKPVRSESEPVLSSPGAERRKRMGTVGQLVVN
jgi:hypothetical protein